MNYSTLPHSELILNDDGSIYHLHLLPQDIAHDIITVGDPERVKMIARHLDSVELTKSHREFTTCTGLRKGKRITIISTGIGTDNIDIVINELDALVNIDLNTRIIKEEHKSLRFFRIGTSGALQSTIPLGTWLVSKSAFGYDGLMPFYGNLVSPQTEAIRLQKHLDGLPLPYHVKASNSLLNLFDSQSYKMGHTLTMAGFYAPQGRALRIPNPTAEKFAHFASFSLPNEEQITNLEMETAGIYGLAEILGHEAVSISALLANRMNGDFHPNPKAVMEDMIEHTLQIILGE